MQGFNIALLLVLENESLNENGSLNSRFDFISHMSPSGISLYSRPRARHPRARYKVKFPRVPFTFRSRITGTKMYTLMVSMAFCVHK